MRGMCLFGMNVGHERPKLTPNHLCSYHVLDGWFQAFPINFVLTLLIILFNVLVSQGLGLALGAILMDVKQATTLASWPCWSSYLSFVTMLIFLVAGGYYILHIPTIHDLVKYIFLSHYCYKLLVGLQYMGSDCYHGLGMALKVVALYSLNLYPCLL